VQALSSFSWLWGSPSFLASGNRKKKFGKNKKKVSRSEVENMWRRTSILHFMVEGKIYHEN